MLGLFLLVGIGLLVGGLASSFTHGGRLGTMGNLVVGVVGSLAGGLLFQQFGTRLVEEHSAILLSFGVALVTAVLLLVIVGLIKR